MPTDPDAKVEPITDADILSVAEFLHSELNSRIEIADWAAAITPPWDVEQPNHGYLLRSGGEVVGAYLAFYSEREIKGARHRICNLAAWCAMEEYRASGLRLLKALLRQRDYHFTDLSPSGNVVPLNERLGFHRLDTTTAVVPNLPLPTRPGRVRVVTAAREIEHVLSGKDLQIYRDHRRAAAARHVVLVTDGEPCYVIFRRDRRKRLPLFASILYVSDPGVFGDCSTSFFRYLLLRRGIPITLAELRVIGRLPPRSVTRQARPKMYFSEQLHPGEIDYLYSELTCVAW